jgi:peptide deformylase
MAVRPVLRMGDARLWEVAKPVAQFATPALSELLRDMRDTMQAMNGAGLAAPQIGVGLRVVIFGMPPSLPDQEKKAPRYPDADSVPETVLINPVVTPMDGQTDLGWEGCLSVPGLRGAVERYSHIRYQGYDENGGPVDRIVSGFHARVVQHECDHLDGILYPMRIKDMTLFGYTAELFPDGDMPDE